MPAEMPKGSVLLYIGSLYHGGGANRSDAPRRGVNVGYTLSWLRQEENQYLACPPEVARELPEALARLAGYRARRVRARLLRRPARPDRGGAGRDVGESGQLLDVTMRRPRACTPIDACCGLRYGHS